VHRLRALPAVAGVVSAILLGLDPAPTRAAEPAQAVPLGLLRVQPLRATDTDARVSLGRKLFMDRRLSRNGSMSCGMCHIPEQAFASNQTNTAIGLSGQHLRRNAPTVLNVGYQQSLFHDGRETSLEHQVWSPLLAQDEMGNRSQTEVVERVAMLSDYRGLLERAFPGQAVTEIEIAAALAAYERTLSSGNSRFDRWYFRGEAHAMSALEQQGFELFTSKAGCSACHLIGTQEALFTDHRFHNTGVGWARANKPPEGYSVPLAPGVSTEVPAAALAQLLGPELRDEGRFEVTGRPEDRWAYKTPSLRNVALTAPYMHDGSLPTLAAVVEFYERGGIDNPGKDPAIRPLGLSTEEKQALEAFLSALTGDNVKQLATEARAAFRSNRTR